MVQANPALAQVPTRRDCAPSPAQPWVYAAFVGGCLAIGAKRPDLALADLAVMWAALAKQTHAAAPER